MHKFSSAVFSLDELRLVGEALRVISARYTQRVGKQAIKVTPRVNPSVHNKPSRLRRRQALGVAPMYDSKSAHERVVSRVRRVVMKPWQLE